MLRHLGRLPIGIQYPEVIERVTRMADQVRGRTGERPPGFVHATGVGQLAVDLFHEKVHGNSVVPVYFAHGDRRTETTERSTSRVNLGKRHLVSGL